MYGFCDCYFSCTNSRTPPPQKKLKLFYVKPNNLKFKYTFELYIQYIFLKLKRNRKKKHSKNI